MIIRALHVNDIFDIFLWRNDAKTVFYSKKSKKIKFSEHIKWFRETITNFNTRIYIGFKKKKQKILKIGIVRFDIKENIAIVSINLNPAMRGRGLSYMLLAAGIKKILKFGKIKLVAEIKMNNLASINCFMKNKFIFFKSKNNYNFYYRCLD